MNLVSASILNVDKENAVHTFYNLETCKIDFFHIDVMDGKFVKKDNSELMLDYAVTLSHITNIGLDVHLMVENVEEVIDDFLITNPDRITFHVEAIKDDFDRFMEIYNLLQEEGIKVGIAISPDTDEEIIKKYLNYVSQVIVMTVVPGEGGQKLIPSTLVKLDALKRYAYENEFDVDFEVDGGINEDTAEDAVEKGANILVMGTALINSDNPHELVDKIKRL